MQAHGTAQHTTDEHTISRDSCTWHLITTAAHRRSRPTIASSSYFYVFEIISYGAIAQSGHQNIFMLAARRQSKKEYRESLLPNCPIRILHCAGSDDALMMCSVNWAISNQWKIIFDSVAPGRQSMHMNGIFLWFFVVLFKFDTRSIQFLSIICSEWIEIVGVYAML